MRFFFCATLLAAATGALANPSSHPVTATLIAEHTALATDRVNWLALRLTPEPGWHVYWRNPGDSGYPTTIHWSLPGHARAGAIVWPAPERHSLGDLVNYGYGSTTLHLVPLTVSAPLPVDLKAQAKWLVCKDVCIPGEATLQLNLPVSKDPLPDPRHAAWFASARAALPQASALNARFAVENGQLHVQMDDTGASTNAAAEFYPYDNSLLNHSAPQRIERDGSTLRLTQTLSTYFTTAPETVGGVLVLAQGKRRDAFEIAASPGAVKPVADHAPAKGPGLMTVLLFALLGGLILNLMPCVFPVLSLKALALMQARDASAAENRRHALAYTAGVVLSCAAVAAVLISLRAGGEALGWGFQLQSPLFVGALAYLMFTLGLSLAGVTDIGTGLMNLGNSLTQSRSLSASFFTGVLALVVASPCTAPFMGTAMGYALTQSAAVSLLIFCTLGLGLALPFLVLGYVPRLATALPKPGAWMERFRQLMAFPLFLTVVWLLWVLMRQAGPDAAAAALAGLVLIAFALWLPAGTLTRVLKLAALAVALALLFAPSSSPTSTVTTGSTEKWSVERVAELRADGRTIFVDFTADWCLTCKVNERVALHTDTVKAAFAKHEVAYLVADWTNPDPAITQALTEFGRAGVPLYLVYVRGGEPKILPQVLTPDIVISSLEK